MKKLLELLKKARKYLGVGLKYLAKLLTWGKKTDEVLEEVEGNLEADAKEKK